MNFYEKWYKNFVGPYAFDAMTLKQVRYMKKQKNLWLSIIIFLYFFFFFMQAPAFAGKIIKNINAEGSCAIIGMSAEQSQMIALQRARAMAIEQAAGVKVTSGTIVTNMALTGEFIKTYAKGFIVKEKVEWLPLGQYQKDKSTPPIPEYRVKIVADVSVPDVKIRPIGITAKTNSPIYKNGEKAIVEIKSARTAQIAIFNITADDKVTMLFPNDYEKNNIIKGGETFIFPHPKSKIEIIVQTLPNHKRDTEALLVVAMDSPKNIEFNKVFTTSGPMGLTTFFQKYATIADYCEEVMLPYEVVDPQHE